MWAENYFRSQVMRAFGDALMFSCGVRDFKLLFPDIKINVDSNHNFIFDNNPYLDRMLKKGDLGVEYYKVGYSGITAANSMNLHFSQLFLLDMLAIVDNHQSLSMSIGEFASAFANGEVGDPDIGNVKKNSNAVEPFISLRDKYRGFCKKFSRQWGDIHLTKEEQNTNVIKDIYKINKYWIISPYAKRDCTAKVYDFRRIQNVIDYFEGLIKFVVIGKSDLLTEKLNNVIDLTDKFNKNPRGLFSLVLHSDGCISSHSLLMHLAAAVNPYRKQGKTPCVVIGGGREPMWSDYTGHQVLHTRGAFDCCSQGGCWKARVIPLPKDPKHNKNLCKHTVQDSGKTVQACMASITSQDVIRAIEKSCGNLYTYLKRKEKVKPKVQIVTRREGKEINLLGNLNSAGGGEQSLCTIAKLLIKAGWKVNLYPMGSVHRNYKGNGLDIMDHNFSNGMCKNMKDGLPLLFYANDSTRKFVDEGQKIVDKSSDVIVGVNYINRPLPNCSWLAKSNKVRGIIFQNKEKLAEFKRDQIGFDDVKLVNLYGAIELNKFLEICPVERKEKKDKLIILKHCTPDFRKYVTKDSEGKGDKIHIWQKKLAKDNDIKFYSRLLKDIDNIEFRFMEAHKELVDHFQNDRRMVFYKWDEIPVTEFLRQGHVYLYRSSNLWRDQYPRVVAEALAAGLPILSEPRDGTLDRIQFGDSGYYCTDYDAYKYVIKLLQRKEDYCKSMGRFSKDWARDNLDPREWCNVIEELV